MTTQTIIPSEELAAGVFEIFATDADAHKSSYLYDHYKRGLAGVMEPSKTAHSAHAAWRAGKFVAATISRTSSAVPAFWAVHSVTGTHIGLWASEDIARRVHREEYPNGTLSALYTHPLPSTEPSEAMVEAALAAVDGLDPFSRHDLRMSPQQFRRHKLRLALRAALNESQSK